MNLRTRISALEQALAPILARPDESFTVQDLTDDELVCLIRQKYPDFVDSDVQTDEQLLAIIAAEQALETRR